MPYVLATQHILTRSEGGGKRQEGMRERAEEAQNNELRKEKGRDASTNKRVPGQNREAAYAALRRVLKEPQRRKREM